MPDLLFYAALVALVTGVLAVILACRAVAWVARRLTGRQPARPAADPAAALVDRIARHAGGPR